MAMPTIYDITDYSNNLIDNGYDNTITIGEDIIIEFMENLYDVHPSNVAFGNIENSVHFVKCTAERIELIIFERMINKLQKEYPVMVKDITRRIEASNLTFPDIADYICYNE